MRSTARVQGWIIARGLREQAYAVDFATDGEDACHQTREAKVTAREKWSLWMPMKTR
jgi:hypothetical protein